MILTAHHDELTAGAWKLVLLVAEAQHCTTVSAQYSWKVNARTQSVAGEISHLMLQVCCIKCTASWHPNGISTCRVCR